MVRAARYLLAGLTAVGWTMALAIAAWAETVELVTYYPTNANTGDLHVRSETVGDAIRNDTPPDGVLLVFDKVGIGLPPGTTDPAGPLHVVGVDDALSNVLFLPGADTGAAGTPDIRVGIGTATPQNSALHIRSRLPSILLQPTADTFARDIAFANAAGTGTDSVWQLSARPNPDPGFSANSFILAHYPGGAFTPRLTVTTAGNVGIGTTAPQSTLHVAPPAAGPGGRLVVDTSFAAGGEGGELALATATPVTANPTWHIDTIFAPNPERLRIFRQPNLGAAGTEAMVIAPIGPFTAQGNPAGYNVGIGTTAPGARLDVNGSVRIGAGGTPIARVISATASLNFPDTDGEDSSRLTVTVSGAAIGDVVSLGIPAAAALSNGIYTAWVSAANTVTVQFSNNNSGANLNPPSATFRIMVVKF